jgi:glycosyltransferase involved in cell wall biosynthesis
LHVGLNLIYLVPGETGGTEIYARELMRALAEVRPDIRLTAFVNRETAGTDGPWSGAAVTVPVNATRRVEWVRGEQVLLPPLAERSGADLVHSLGNTGPAWGRIPRVVTIHDLLYRQVPESHFGVRGLGMRVLVPLAARRSDRVLTVSQSARAEIIRDLHVPGARIDVVPNGLGRNAVAAALDAAEVRARFDLGDRKVLLSVSTKRPHKNLPRVLEALALLPADRRPLLVLPGYHTPHEDELREQASRLGLADDVRLAGWVDAEALEGLYAVADAFVFASLYEGFGLPVLEAMYRGIPVACSRRSAIPEVAGSAARYFDPERPDSIAAAIAIVLDDPAERDRLRKAGPARAARFSWEAAARGVAASYERVLGMGPSRRSRASR